MYRPPKKVFLNGNFQFGPGKSVRRKEVSAKNYPPRRGFLIRILCVTNPCLKKCPLEGGVLDREVSLYYLCSSLNTKLRVTRNHGKTAFKVRPLLVSHLLHNRLLNTLKPFLLGQPLFSDKWTLLESQNIRFPNACHQDTEGFISVAKFNWNKLVFYWILMPVKKGLQKGIVVVSLYDARY